MDKVAVTGAAGQLGSELCERLGERAIPLDLPEADITRRAFFDELRRMRPAVVIHAAAYTNVDGAEAEPEICNAVNVTPVERLASLCRKIDAQLVQISTDYVFCGERSPRRPLLETDEPTPEGVYASGKLRAEHFAAIWERHTIVRTCGLYAPPREGRNFRNFVQTMLRLSQRRGTLRVVNDQHCSPTFVPHLAAAILHLVEQGALGIYHVVNQGETTWYDFARELFRQAGVDVPIEPITTEEYAAVAPRPSYSVLDTAKYHALGGPPMPDWRQGLREYLAATADVGIGR